MSRHHVDRGLQVVVGDARVDDRVLAGRGRVQLAAERVEDLGDLLRAVRARSLEEQVLDEVRDAGLRVALVARAGADPEAERDGAHLREALGDDPFARVELGHDVLLHRRIVTGCSSRATTARRCLRTPRAGGGDRERLTSARPRTSRLDRATCRRSTRGVPACGAELSERDDARAATVTAPSRAARRSGEDVGVRTLTTRRIDRLRHGRVEVGGTRGVEPPASPTGSSRESAPRSASSRRAPRPSPARRSRSGRSGLRRRLLFSAWLRAVLRADASPRVMNRTWQRRPASDRRSRRRVAATASTGSHFDARKASAARTRDAETAITPARTAARRAKAMRSPRDGEPERAGTSRATRLPPSLDASGARHAADAAAPRVGRGRRPLPPACRGASRARRPAWSLPAAIAASSRLVPGRGGSPPEQVLL